jgi:cation transporter-like permease
MRAFVKAIAVILLIWSAFLAIAGITLLPGSDPGSMIGMAMIAGALACSLFAGVGWIVADAAARLTRNETGIQERRTNANQAETGGSPH